MKYAKKTGDTIVEIFVCPSGLAITDCFHPEIAASYFEVPDDVGVGDLFLNGEFVKPDPVEEVQPDILTPVQFKLLFTSAERVALSQVRKTDPVIEDFFMLLDDPRLTELRLSSSAVKDALAYMVKNDHLTQARADKISSGKEP